MSTVRREYVGLGLDVTDIFKYEDYDRVETELTKRGLDITDTNSMGDGREFLGRLQINNKKAPEHSASGLF